MRGIALVSVCLVLVAPGAAAAARPAPTIVISHSQPFTVRGAHFRSGERVVVTVTSDGSYVQRVRASRSGELVATFPDVVFGPCGGMFVRAVGSLGSRAAARLRLRACIPAHAP